MGVLVAALVVIASSIGATKQGVFEKGYDTTRKDTYAFEKQALETKLARLESKQRKVIELSSIDAKTMQMQAKLKMKEDTLKAKIAKIEAKETELGLN